MRNVISVIIVIAISLAFSNCSKRQYMTPTSMIQPDSLLDINDENIRKAFELQPQLFKPMNVAVYKAGFSDHAFIDSLKAMPGVANVFEISPWLVEGDAYHNRRSNRWYRYYNTPGSTNVNQLRYIAAQAKTDLLIYCGVSHTFHTKPNILGWTYIALVTALFVPGMEADITTEADIFFVDVRNGYLYGSYHDDTSFHKGYVTIYYHDSLDEKVAELTGELIPGMVDATRNVINNEEYFLETE